MDAKEVELRGKALTKAISGGEPSASLVKLLNDLKDGMKATEDILRQTKIGVTVNRLRTHKDPAVQKLAQELVNKWKDQVNKSKKQSGPTKASTPSNAQSTASPMPPSATASPVPIRKKHNVDPAKRTYKSDKVNTDITGNQARDAFVGLIYNGLAFMSDELPDPILAVAREVEAAAFATNDKTLGDGYKSKMSSLFQNLKSKSNPTLRQRVLSGEISPKRFATMTLDEMKSDERKAEEERLKEENMNDAMVAQVEKSISKEFQCGKCKQKMVSYSQAQTRSADEPMTTFCECMNCGNRWKFS